MTPVGERPWSPLQTSNGEERRGQANRREGKTKCIDIRFERGRAIDKEWRALSWFTIKD